MSFDEEIERVLAAWPRNPRRRADHRAERRALAAACAAHDRGAVLAACRSYIVWAAARGVTVNCYRLENFLANHLDRWVRPAAPPPAEVPASDDLTPAEQLLLQICGARPSLAN